MNEKQIESVITDKNFISNNADDMRNSEQQIEEMAKVLDECCNRYDEDGNFLGNKCSNCEYWSDTNHLCCSYGVREATHLYNAGYRKQSEGEWIDKPTGAYSRMQSWCSACGKHSGIGGIESNRHKPYCPHCGAKMEGESK